MQVGVTRGRANDRRVHDIRHKAFDTKVEVLMPTAAEFLARVAGAEPGVGRQLLQRLADIEIAALVEGLRIDGGR